MQTYGDAAKTKTIARRKAERIVKILRGEDRSNGADSSKFRFWVRAKGFRLGPPPTSAGQPASDKSPSSSCVKDRTNSTGSHVQSPDEAEELFVVTSTTKVSHCHIQFRSHRQCSVAAFFLFRRPPVS